MPKKPEGSSDHVSGALTAVSLAAAVASEALAHPAGHQAELAAGDAALQVELAPAHAEAELAGDPVQLTGAPPYPAGGDAPPELAGGDAPPELAGGDAPPEVAPPELAGDAHLEQRNGRAVRQGKWVPVGRRRPGETRW